MGQEIQVVIFKIYQQKYAVDIAQVGRIIGFSETTLIPETSNYILGVITYQEKILPIVDLNMRFYKKGTEHGKDSKILVINWDQCNLGLLVDEVLEIKNIEKESIEAPPTIVNGISQKYIKGLIKKDKDIIIYLEVEEVFTGSQEKELKEIIFES